MQAPPQVPLSPGMSPQFRFSPHPEDPDVHFSTSTKMYFQNQDSTFRLHIMIFTSQALQLDGLDGPEGIEDTSRSSAQFEMNIEMDDESKKDSDL